MKISLAWLNTYLSPPIASTEEAERLLTFAGFPLESVTPIDGGDHLLDVEVTSNRGDCLSHVGVARELAAASHGVHTLKPPASAPKADASVQTSSLVALHNHEPKVCARFTLRVIKGVKVGPSPKWLQERLIAIGLRPINNVVDATNFVQHELGSPSHVFDLATVAKNSAGLPEINVRFAKAGEKLVMLDGKAAELRATDLVVCDAHAPESLAGVMGGLRTGVTESTRDVLLEVATWDPATIRTAARRLNIRTDAGYRFERVVDPRTIDFASDRLCELIVQLAGGQLASGRLEAGAPMKPLEVVVLRLDRCRSVLGAGFSDQQISAALSSLGFGVSPVSGGVVQVTIPAHRPDVRLEIDLIEEAGRTIGYEKLHLPEKLPVRVSGLQTSEQATRELWRVLTGAGFFETITFSFLSPKNAKPFLPNGLSLLGVSEERRGSENIVRPSIVPSLLLCRAGNQHARVEVDGGVRLFELASVYGEQAPASGKGPGTSVESRNVALLADITPAMGANAFERRQNAVRLMRGVIDQLVHALHGPMAKVEIAPGVSPYAGYDASAVAAIALNGQSLGVFGIIADATQKQFELATPVVCAELSLKVLTAGYPPKSLARGLPSFPASDRDLSVIVDEKVSWAQIERTLGGAGLGHLESWKFTGVYRGQPLASGKKSVTFRMTFRDEARTLVDDEVNAQVDKLVANLGAETGATVRTA
jgi:phenylalanyl-tRNA synthetase beta chain